MRPCGPSFPNVCVRVAAFYSFFTVFRNAPPHPTRGGIPRESIIVGRERCARACVRACSSAASNAKARRKAHFGFRSTKMTESPLRNILLMKRSLFTGLDAFFPRPVFGTCREREGGREREEEEEEIWNR